MESGTYCQREKAGLTHLKSSCEDYNRSGGEETLVSCNSDEGNWLLIEKHGQKVSSLLEFSKPSGKLHVFSSRYGARRRILEPVTAAHLILCVQNT